jgi:hypothetical protein
LLFPASQSIQPISQNLSSNKPPTIQGMFDVDRWFQISKMLVLLAESDVTESYVPRKSQRPFGRSTPGISGVGYAVSHFVLALRSRFTQKGCFTHARTVHWPSFRGLFSRVTLPTLVIYVFNFSFIGVTVGLIVQRCTRFQLNA